MVNFLKELVQVLLCCHVIHLVLCLNISFKVFIIAGIVEQVGEAGNPSSFIWVNFLLFFLSFFGESVQPLRPLNLFFLLLFYLSAGK